MSTQRFAGRLKLDLTTLQASQETCGYTSTVPNLRESAQMRKSVYENVRDQSKCLPLCKNVWIEQAQIFRKPPWGFLVNLLHLHGW